MREQAASRVTAYVKLAERANFFYMRAEQATSFCKVRLDEPSECEKEDARSERVHVFSQRARASRVESRRLNQGSSSPCPESRSPGNRTSTRAALS